MKIWVRPDIALLTSHNRNLPEATDVTQSEGTKALNSIWWSSSTIQSGADKAVQAVKSLVGAKMANLKANGPALDHVYNKSWRVGSHPWSLWIDITA